MISQFRQELKTKNRHLVQILRPPDLDMPDVFGFVVGQSEDLVLLHSFDSEVFCLNGYDVIRLCDIYSYCFFDDPRYWRFRALRRLKIRPTPPDGIELTSMRNLLSSIRAHYPLLSAHRETARGRTTFVGPVIHLSERTFTIEDADYYGQWTAPRRMRYADVTRVCFDGGYLRASAMTLNKVRKGQA